MASMVSEGGCLCGAIRYRVHGKPLNSMVCHCRTCRRLSGAPVVAWVGFSLDKFELLRGEPAQFQSSEPVMRRFCPSCGTPLTYQHRDDTGYIDITTCSLDDPDAFPPTHHSWTSHDVAWVKFGDGVPQYEKSRYDSPDPSNT